MLPQQRRERILAAVRASGAIRAADLVEELGVSEMTVRRDIADLAARGLVRKVHGGAVDAQPGAYEPSFTTKRELARAQKMAIAEAAADLITPGSAVALSAGSTTNALAAVIAGRPDLRPLTVVTNSLSVADTLHTTEEPHGQGGPGVTGGVEVILTGGSRTPSNALVGSVAQASLARLRVDLLFLGVHGMDLEAGLTTPNMAEADTNRTLRATAARTVVLADSSKWGTVGLSRIMSLSEVDVLITDDGLSEVAIADAATIVGRLICVSAPQAQPSKVAP